VIVDNRYKAGQSEKAETILEQTEAIAGTLGLFAEGIDARSKTFLSKRVNQFLTQAARSKQSADHRVVPETRQQNF
jgi:hypothetical protein